MSDYINRRAAIDAVNGMPDCPNGYSDTYDKAHIIAVLEDVPSVQPEIIRCKDCKWCEDADGLMCKNTASWVVATDYDFGCVCAERRQNG